MLKGTAFCASGSDPADGPTMTSAIPKGKRESMKKKAGAKDLECCSGCLAQAQTMVWLFFLHLLSSRRQQLEVWAWSFGKRSGLGSILHAYDGPAQV